MGKYFITGRNGSGKTTVITELQRRGYTAYNTDDLTGVTLLQNKETGEIVDWPKEPVDWDKFSWNWQSEEINKLLASDETIFIGAVTHNQADFYDKFDAVFVLSLSQDVLRKHLENHEHGYTPAEIDRIVERHPARHARFIEQGGIEIPNERPIAEVVDDIIKRIEHAE